MWYSSNARDSQLCQLISKMLSIGTRYRVIYNSLRLYYPSLIPFFRFKYEHPSSMRNNAGITVASNRTGVGQPVSNLLFSAPKGHLRLSRSRWTFTFPVEKVSLSRLRMLLRPWGMQELLSALLHSTCRRYIRSGWISCQSHEEHHYGQRHRDDCNDRPPSRWFPLKGLQCSGFLSGTENAVDRWPSASSVTCSQVLLPCRSWAPGLLLLLFCPLFMMSSSSNPDNIVEYTGAFDAHTVSTVTGILHTEVTDKLKYRCFLPP